MKTQPFRLHSPFAPTGDQPDAIAKLTAGFEAGMKYQTLLGVTGSGKTFTGERHSESEPTDAHSLAQQDPRRSALHGVPRVLPRKRR